MQFTMGSFREALSGFPRNELLFPKFEGIISWNRMRITCNSHCLSKIFAVSPFSKVREFADAYRRLFRMTLLCS